MSLEQILRTLRQGRYDPKSLYIVLPPPVLEGMSDKVQQFLEHGIQAINPASDRLFVANLMLDAWTERREAMAMFRAMSLDERVEALAIMCFFVHETTHRVDLLISPFGLQYYANLLREYWNLQHFVPQMLDRRETIRQLRFLAGLSEEFDPAGFHEELTEIWPKLEELIKVSYAWGDVANVQPLGKFITPGWGQGVEVPPDPFCVDFPLEAVNVLGFFHSFRPPDARFWYLRPMTILETKAVCNTLIFVLHLLKPDGIAECRRFFQAVYLDNADEMPPDYLFLMDIGARLLGAKNFETLLALGDRDRLAAALRILSSLCWFALQTPPPGPRDDPRASNPVLRLWAGALLTQALISGKLKTEATSAADLFQEIETHHVMRDLFQVPITTSLDRCREIIDWLIDRNRTETWHPEVRRHFDHLFAIMRPHFADRPDTYVSQLGMPDMGSPLLHARDEHDIDVMATDYDPPQAALEWFSLRNDLYFNMLAPEAATIAAVHSHFKAFLLPFFCDCSTVTPQWVSQYAESWTVGCGGCGQKKTLTRDDITMKL